MKIRAINQTGLSTFDVTLARSDPESAEEVLQVDLAANGFNGSCTCGTFNFYCDWMLKRGDNPKKRHRCEHITSCMAWWMENRYPEIVADQARRNIVPLPKERKVVGI